MNRLFVVGLVLIISACKNERHEKASITAINKKDSLQRVLTYGISQLSGGAAEVFVAKQYGFCYYPVTGCVLTKELLDSIDKENKKVYQTLAEEYGTNWKQQYTQKVDSLSGLLKQVKEIISNEPLVQQISNQHSGGLYYHIIPADTANIFDVQAFSADTSNLSYTFKVNIQTRQVDRIR